MFNFKKYVTNQYEINFNGQRYLKVEYSDNSSDIFDLILLGVQWFLLSNDEFFNKYGLDFNPQQYNIYAECKAIANNVNG